MIDHVSIAVRDLALSARFYEAVLATLGFAKLEARPATVGFGRTYSEFWINLRGDLTPAPAGSGAHVRFSNRPVGVKHFQAIHHCSVDVAHGLALLFGIGTKALPSWDPRTRRNNLFGGLAVS